MPYHAFYHSFDTTFGLTTTSKQLSDKQYEFPLGDLDFHEIRAVVNGEKRQGRFDPARTGLIVTGNDGAVILMIDVNGGVRIGNTDFSMSPSAFVRLFILMQAKQRVAHADKLWNYFSGAALQAMTAAFEEHKKRRDLPANLRTIDKYDLHLLTTSNTYEVAIVPVPPKGMIAFHPRFGGSYVLDKTSLKLLEVRRTT